MQPVTWDTPLSAADRETVQKLRLYLDVPGARAALNGLRYTAAEAADVSPPYGGIALALSVLCELAAE